MEALVLLNHFVEGAKRAGARASEVLLLDERTLQLRHTPDKPLATESQAQLRLTLRVFLDGGRMGRLQWDAASLSDLDRQARPLVDQALALAASAVPDPLAAPSDRHDLDPRGLGLLDRRMDLLRPIERREMIEDNAENLRKSFPQAILREILYREVRTSRSFASYRGVSVNETASLFEARATALDPGDGAAFSEEVRSRVFANLVSLPFGTELGKRMARLQVADRLPEGKSLVFIPPRVVADLMNALAPAFVASEVHGGRSFVRDFLGKSLGAPRLHVIDDPGIPGALYTRAFDDRGIPPSPVVLLREGRAFGLYYDLETARRQDTTPTGHGVGERAEPSNIIVRSGTRSRNAIGMDLGDYLVLDGLLSPSPLDLERGTLDSICDVLVFRKNTFCGSARHLRLRTPLTKLLLGIREIADDQTRLGNVDACSLLVEGLEFTPL